MTLETDQRAASTEQQVGVPQWAHKAESKLKVMLPQLEALRARHQQALSRNKQLKALVSDLAQKQQPSPASTPSVSHTACLPLPSPTEITQAPCEGASVPSPAAAGAVTVAAAGQGACLPLLEQQQQQRPSSMAGQAPCVQEHSLGHSSGAPPHQPSTPSTGPTSTAATPQQGLGGPVPAAVGASTAMVHSHPPVRGGVLGPPLAATDPSGAGPPAPSTIQRSRCKRTPAVHRSPAPSGACLSPPAPGAAGPIAAAVPGSSAPVGSSNHACPAASAATAAALLLSSPQLQEQQQQPPAQGAAVEAVPQPQQQAEGQQEDMEVEEEQQPQQEQDAMEPAPSAGLDALVEAALLQAPSTVLPARGARRTQHGSWEGAAGAPGSAAAGSTRRPPGLFVHVEDPSGDLPQAVMGLAVSAQGPRSHQVAPGDWTGDGASEEDLYGAAIAALASGRGSPQQHVAAPWVEAGAGAGHHPRQQMQGGVRKRRRPARSNSSDEEWSEGEEAAYLRRQQQAGRRGTRTRQLHQTKGDGTYEYYAPSSSEGDGSNGLLDPGPPWVLVQEVPRAKRSRLLHAPKHHQQPLPAKQQHLARLQQVVAHLLEYVPSDTPLPSPLPSPRGGRSSGCSSPRPPAPRSHKRGRQRMSPRAAAAVAANRLRAFAGMSLGGSAAAGDSLPGGPATPSLEGRGWRPGMLPPRPLHIPGSPKGNLGPYVQVFSPTGLPSVLTLSPGPASLGLPWNPLSPGSPMRLLSPIGTADTPLRAMYATFAASPLRTGESQLGLPSPAFGSLVVNGAPLTSLPGSPSLVAPGEAREGAGWAARSRAVRSNAAAAAALLTRAPPTVPPPAAAAAAALGVGGGPSSSLAVQRGGARPLHVTPARPLGPGTLSLRPDGQATWMPLNGGLPGGAPRPSVSAAGPGPMPQSIRHLGFSAAPRSSAVKGAALKHEAAMDHATRGAGGVSQPAPAPAPLSLAAVGAAAAAAAAGDPFKRSASEAAAAAAAAEAAEAAEAAAAAAVAAVRAAGLPEIKAEVL